MVDKHVLIITGGHIEDTFALEYIKDNSFDMLITADSGLNFCRRTDIVPDMILGDFDSTDSSVVDYYMTNYGDRVQRFNPVKDETDTELAIIRAIEAGATDITILGATGTRIDHVLGNINLLMVAMDENVNCCIVDSHNRIRMINKGIKLRKEEAFGKYVSLIPFTESVKGLTLKGFAYNLDNFVMRYGKSRGVSNEIREEQATIDFSEGILLVIESCD